MLESFINVGVVCFDVLRTTLNKEGLGYWSARSPAQLRSLLPSLIESSAREQLNVIVRPHVDPPVSLIQLDDIHAEKIERVRPLAFLIIQTSPGRYQAWLAVDGCEGDFCYRVRQAAGADMGANGWVRLAGSLNVKPKYHPNFPVVQVVDVRLGLKASPATIYLLGLLADRRVVSSPSPAGNGVRPRRFPSYQRFFDRARSDRMGRRTGAWPISRSAAPRFAGVGPWRRPPLS